MGVAWVGRVACWPGFDRRQWLAAGLGGGLGYSVVPQWLVSQSDPHIGQIVIADIPPVTVYFAHTTLLSSNAFVHQLHETCARIMGAQLGKANQSLKN
jgi:hypothetical protein